MAWLTGEQRVWAWAIASALGEIPRSGGRASTHRHHCHHAQQAGRTYGSAWVFRVAGCPRRPTLTSTAGNRRPQRNTIRAPALAGRSASATTAPQADIHHRCPATGTHPRCPATHSRHHGHTASTPPADPTSPPLDRLRPGMPSPGSIDASRRLTG